MSKKPNKGEIMRHVLMFAFLTMLVACGGGGGAGAPAGGGGGGGDTSLSIPRDHYIFKSFSDTFSFHSESFKGIAKAAGFKILDDDPTPILTVQTDVYVAGFAENDTDYVGPRTAIYWKNGDMTVLDDLNNSQANAIYVDSDDTVYVVGMDQTNKGALWVNGVLTVLTGSADYAEAFAITKYSGDVYIAGNTYGGDDTRHAGYWVNNVFHALPENGSNSFAYSIFFDDSGSMYIAGSTGGYAVYWKDGELVELQERTGHGGLAKSVIMGNDGSVYATGSVDAEYLDLSPDLGIVAVYWKDGQITQLSLGSRIESVHKQGDSLVLTGDWDDNGTRVALVWGATDLYSSLELTSYITASAINGTDIYASGVLGSDNGNHIAAIWVNGVKKDLSDPLVMSADANAIFVK